MTPLQRKALASLPLNEATVELAYLTSRATNAESLRNVELLRKLCVSHERLRAEIQGLEVLREDAEKEVRALKALVATAAAMTDTGSREFRDRFPPRSVGEAIDPTAIVPGWRVVEAIREVLLS